MKRKIYLMLLLSLILVSCHTSSRYALSDGGKDKAYLIDYIDKLVKYKTIKKHPLIVIDGKPYRYDVELKESKLPLAKDEIAEIVIADREKAKKIFGEPAKNGVLLITTKSSLNKNK